MNRLLLRLVDISRTTTPLVIINTHDMIDALGRIQGLPRELDTLNLERAKNDLDPLTVPRIVEWSPARGLTYPAALKDALEEAAPIRDPDQMFPMISTGFKNKDDRILDRTWFVMLAAGEILRRSTPDVISAIIEARRTFVNPTVKNCLVLLTDTLEDIPQTVLDVATIINDPLPTKEEVEAMARTSLTLWSKMSTAKFKTPTSRESTKIGQALQGMTPFKAQASLRQATTAVGVDVPRLLEAQVDNINAAPGLHVLESKGTFADLGGLDRLKGFLNSVLGQGENGPKLVVFVDEADKQLDASSKDDSSGVSQAQNGKLLTHLQHARPFGITLLGPPGTGKSAIAAACGNENNLLTISFSIGSTKGKYVGESEGKLDRTLKLLESLYGSGTVPALWIVTCNNLERLAPEMRRRFSTCFFVDLPTKEERTAIWKIYLEKYGRVGEDLPEDVNWTGAEIEKACIIAQTTGCSLIEAADFVVPVYTSSRKEIDALRGKAQGNYLSCTESGTFKMDKPATVSDLADLSLSAAQTL